MADRDKLATRHSYKTYTELFKRDYNKNKTQVNTVIFCLIVNEFFKFIMGLVLNGESVKLPYRTGTILISGKKTKPLLDDEGNIKGVSPDWVKTKALWNQNPEAKEQKKVIYLFNEHTHGLRYKIMWAKRWVDIPNIDLYSLVFSRDNKRAVMAKINEGKEYLVRK